MNLAEHIAAHFPQPHFVLNELICAGCDFRVSFDLGKEALAEFAAHISSSWAEHRTITTVKDGLDLPDGTVLRDVEGEVHLLHVPSPTPISLPARIIFHPEEDQ